MGFFFFLFLSSTTNGEKHCECFSLNDLDLLRVTCHAYICAAEGLDLFSYALTAFKCVSISCSPCIA